MKKFLSLFLSAIMLLSVTAGINFTAFAAYTLETGGSVNIDIPAGETVKISFTPSELLYQQESHLLLKALSINLMI